MSGKTKDGVMVELDKLALEYSSTKDEECFNDIITILEPLIKNRVASLVYSYERQFGKHLSDFEGLCQDMRVLVFEILGKKKWKIERGHFKTYINKVFTNKLISVLRAKHNGKKSKIVDYEISLDAKRFEDDLPISDRLVGIPASQEEMVMVAELSKAVTEALSNQIIESARRRKIFILLLNGESEATIANAILCSPNTVRSTVRSVVKQMRRTIPSYYKVMYDGLSDSFVKQVKIQYNSMSAV